MRKDQAEHRCVKCNRTLVEHYKKLPDCRVFTAYYPRIEAPMHKSKTVQEAIERAAQAFPRREGQSDHETHQMMRNRYQHRVDDIGEMPTLNDED